MAIPTYEDLLSPLLQFSADKQEHSIKDPIDYTATRFNLSEEEKNRLEPSKKRTLLYIRIGWALTYLRQAGLVYSTKRGFFRITDRGMGVVKQNPKEIDVKYLQQFPEFIDFQNRSRKGDEDPTSDLKPIEKDELTPEEKMEEGFNMIQEKLKDELLTTIKKSSPIFFESLVVDLLVSMGYGGSIKEAGRAIGKTGDEGIDGIIKEGFSSLLAHFL